MSEKEVKPEAAEPANSKPGCEDHITAYSEKTSLGGPVPVLMGGGPMPCKLKLSSKILAAAGLKPNDRIELISVGDGQILIKKIGEPLPGLPFKSTNGTSKMLDILMTATREREAEMREARERRYAYQEEPEAEDEAEGGAEPLDEVQCSREELQR